LFRAAYRFDFFQAVRMAERVSPGEPVGRDHSPGQEALRFRSLPSLRFPTGSVAGLRRRSDGKSGRPELEMVVTFMGLTGPAGVLPHHYTRLLIQRLRDRDTALRDFLDIFNHRLISLFYRAWEKCHFPAAYDETRGRQHQEDLFTAGLYCLVGLGSGGLRKRLKVGDEAFLSYAAFFADQHRPAVCIPRMLASYFEVPVELDQLAGQWLRLDPSDRSSLPGPGCPDGQHNQLGAGLLLGGQVWDIQGKFRLRVGPLDYAQFRHWIPTADALRPFCQMVRAYVGPELQFEVQVLLKRPQLPPCRLGGGEDYQPLLGWTTWLLARPAREETGCSEDAVFSLDDV